MDHNEKMRRAGAALAAAVDAGEAAFDPLNDLLDELDHDVPQEVAARLERVEGALRAALDYARKQANALRG